MAQAPQFKIYNPSGEYVASAKYGEDAAMIVAAYGDGAKIKNGHSHVVWSEGSEEFNAAESYDRVAHLINDRIVAAHRAAYRKAYGRDPN